MKDEKHIGLEKLVLDDRRRRLAHQPHWDTPYLNSEAGPIEAKRFHEYQEWAGAVEAAAEGKRIESDLVAWYARIDPSIEYRSMIRGLDVTYGAVTFSLVHDYPRTVAVFQGKAPAYNRPLRIRAVTAFHTKDPRLRYPLVVVDEWEPADAIEWYVDAGMSAQDVTNFTNDALEGISRMQATNLLASGFASPPLEQPGGGVAVHNLAGASSRVSSRILADFELGLPPPMRSSKPRSVTHVGEEVRGTRMHLTTALPISKHRFTPTDAPGPRDYHDTLLQVRSQPGENSLYGIIGAKGTSDRAALGSLLQGAVAADAFSPQPIDEALAGVETRLYIKEMDSRHWAAIAKARTTAISFDESSPQLGQTARNLRESTLLGLEIAGLPEAAASSIADHLRPAGRWSLARLAHATARGRGANHVTREDFDAAARHVETAIKELLERPEVKKHLLGVFEKYVPGDRFATLFGFIAAEPGCTPNEAYQGLRHELNQDDRPLFSDEDDFMGLVAWGRREGKWVQRGGRVFLE